MKTKLLLVLIVLGIMCHRQIEGLLGLGPAASPAPASETASPAAIVTPSPALPVVVAATPSPARRFFEEKGYANDLDKGAVSANYHQGGTAASTPDPSVRMKKMILNAGGE